MQKHFPEAHRSGEGFLVMLSVLIVGAVGLSISVSVLLLGVSASRTSFTNELSSQSRALTDGCVEEALERIRKESTYVGYATHVLENGECSYEVLNIGGENRTVYASSTVQTVTRKVQVTLDQVTPTLSITSWQEVSDF